ncbi:MAG: response regulator [Lachnospiraceae bacterium]|nr:response regulator [Lachnospiraceae bacterium]
MSLYSVLMVDDEEEVIRIIRKKINWEEIGFQVCGYARNGIEALEMVEELQPDVIMTDIKMPYMDGLELAARIKEQYPGTRIIIFSGFDEFDYVKQAIGLEVEQYLLKPLDSVEIRQVFEKVKISLDADRNLKNNIAHLERYYEKSLPLLREGFLASLLDDAVPDHKLKGYLDEYRISLDGPFFAVAIIHTSSRSAPEGMSASLLRLSVRQLVDQSSISSERDYIFNYRNNIVAVTQLEKKEEIARYTDLCDRFCKSAKRSCQAIVTIGIGQVVDQVHDLILSYKGAREALSYRTLYGAGNAINIVEIDPRDTRAVVDIQDSNDLHDIFKQIKMGNTDSLEKAVNRFVLSLKSSNINMQGFSLILMELLTGFYRFLINNEIDTGILSEEHEDVYTELLQMDSMEDIQNWLFHTSMKIQRCIQEQRSSKTGSFVREAQNYVLENYSNPELSIDLICSELGVSSAYFSTVFKRETGKTFINYLTEIRMKEAERLLVEQDEKKYIIAEKVGYSDPSYFSYVFKKWFGVSPMKYKQGSRNSL